MGNFAVEEEGVETWTASLYDTVARSAHLIKSINNPNHLSIDQSNHKALLSK